MDSLKFLYMFVGFGIAWLAAALCILLLAQRTRKLRDDVKAMEKWSAGR